MDETDAVPTPEPKLLLLVDGSSYLYRAFHAMPDLRAVPGVEADDVIGTLACMATEQDISTIISSGDKDLSQLVNEHVTVIDTMNDRRRDVAGVEAEFGVPPRLMVDYQTLVGDSVDNVPGVDKVGPKTAVKLLLQYGSLDALVEK
ncbi:MAG: hypothetical protein EOO24_42840, partial [Comamonadaceae bacterium]